MNGFILSCSPSKNKLTAIKYCLPNLRTEEFHFSGKGLCIQISTWEENSGDVHIASISDYCFLILSGYFSETKSLGSITDQPKAVASILQTIDHRDPENSLHDFAKDAFGSFSLIYINIETSKIAGVTDQINSRPIWYYYNSTDNWHFSTHILPIKYFLGSASYDLGALASLMIYGGPIDPNKSIYKSIVSIPSGSVFSANDDNRIQIRQWYNFQHRPENKYSMSDWVRLGVERIRAAAHRHVSSAMNSLLFLSGGVDSRLVACALRDAGATPILYTLCDSINIETRIAKLVARSLRCEHLIFQRDQYYYLDHIPNNMLESGGSYVWTHSHFSKAYRHLADQRAFDCVMLGDFCETFSKLFCTTDIAKLALSSEDNFLRFFDQLHLPLYRPPHKDLTLKLFTKDIRSDIIDALHDDIITRYQNHLYISVDPLIVADRIRRTGSAGTAPTFQMFLDVRSIASERNLFLDQDIYSLLEILPSKIRNQAGFAAKIIYEFSPKTSSIPNSNTLVPLHWPKLLHEKTKSLKPHIGALKRKLISNTHKTSGSWPKKEIFYKNNDRWNNYISDLIENDDLFDNHYFDRDAIRHFWSEYNNGRIELSTDIERLISIAEINRILINF